MPACNPRNECKNSSKGLLRTKLFQRCLQQDADSNDGQQVALPINASLGVDSTASDDEPFAAALAGIFLARIVWHDGRCRSAAEM